MQKTTNSLIFVFIVNISMHKIILEVEYFKSMIYQLFKIFKTKNTGLLIFNSLKQKKMIFKFFVYRNLKNVTDSLKKA